MANRQIRSLVLRVHPVSPSAVCAAQVSPQIQPVISCVLWWRLAD